MADEQVKPPVTAKAWGKIEADYRAGVKSLRQIAADHGISEGAIRKRAKKEDWERDLAQKVQAKADALVRKATVREEVREKNRVPESVIVEDNANAVAHVMLSQRTDIQRNRKLAMKLLDELEGQCDNPDLLAQLGALMYAPDENGKDKLNELYHKVIAMPGRVDSMKKLADTLKVLVALEREAYNIAPEPQKGDSYEDLLDDD